MTLLEEFDALCKYIREVTGSDLVCGLCEYDAGTVGEEPMECPGFDSNECFKLSESFKHRFPVYNGHEVTRCKDCRYFGKRMINRYWSCGRKEGCVETIPEGFCGWAVPGGRKHTKQYKVKAEFCDLWNASEDDIIIEDEVKRLALEWGTSVEQLLEQLEEV